MKKFFFSLVALAAVTMSYAQNTLVATLTHEGNMSVYYGENAFVQAHAAAENGDLITLSNGNFKCESITKAVTIRGTASQSYSERGIVRTALGEAGKTTVISSPTDTEYTLNAEGIAFCADIGRSGTNSILRDVTFTKCYFQASISYCSLYDVSFTQCYVNYFSNYYAGSNPLFVNSIVIPGGTWNDATSATFVNCFVDDHTGYGFGILENCIFQNCILSDIYGNKRLSSSNIANNCVGYYINNYYGSSNSSIFSSLNSSSNNTWLGYKQNAAGMITSFYNPTDEIRENYLGDDGTEVGVYGGMYPYDPVPSTPRITKCEVAKRPTADGKLSVNIEVSTPEQ